MAIPLRAYLQHHGDTGSDDEGSDGAHLYGSSSSIDFQVGGGLVLDRGRRIGWFCSARIDMLGCWDARGRSVGYGDARGRRNDGGRLDGGNDRVDAGGGDEGVWCIGQGLEAGDDGLGLVPVGACRDLDGLIRLVPGRGMKKGGNSRSPR